MESDNINTASSNDRRDPQFSNQNPASPTKRQIDWKFLKKYPIIQYNGLYAGSIK